jgi:glycosyltransferase involved in cell wall biosynthesis
MKSNKKNILIVAPDLTDIGGVANYYNSIWPFLVKDGLNIEILEIGSTKGKGNPFYPVCDQINCAKLLKRQRLSLLHVNPSLGLKSFIRDGLFIYQAVQKKIPVVVFFRGWDVDFAKKLEKYFFKFFCATYGKADSFIVLSSEFKKKLRFWNVQVPIFVETTTVDPSLVKHFDINQRLNSIQKKDHFRVLFLARLETAKGIFETVNAIKMLCEKKLPITLSIAGDGPARKQLETYVRQLSLQPGKINFLGYIRGNQKTLVFSEHDIYCFPTYYGEGLPNSVLEALAFGMPVITCAVGGLADIFLDGKMGELVPVRDTRAVAHSLERLICDQNSMVRMAEYNYAYAKENFHAPKVANRLLGIYQQIIENH